MTEPGTEGDGPIRREIIDTVVQADDLELHTSLLHVDGRPTLVDFRQFVPSLGRYGRGVTFPARLLPDAANGLIALVEKIEEAGPDGTGVGVG